MRRILPECICAIATALWLGASAIDYSPCLHSSASVRHRPVFRDEGRLLRVAAGNWDAAIIVGRIAQIILNEGVGVETDFDHGYSGSADVIRNLTGCLDAACSLTGAFPYAHMDFENWDTEEGNSILRAQPGSLLQGVIGYDGQEGLYMQEAIAAEVWRDHWLPLEYFRSLHHPRRPWMGYFTRPRDIFIPADSGCRGSIADRMASADFPCESDGWWYSPACAFNHDECIPAIMGGIGSFGLEVCRVIKYSDIPMAVTFLAWPDQRVQNGTVKAFFFWWRPDWAFNAVGTVRRLLFPEHDQEEWSGGIYRTAFPDFTLSKYAWRGVAEMSPRAFSLFKNMSLTSEQVNDFMDQMHIRQHAGDLDVKFTIACEWVRANQALWRQWIPCSLGEGATERDCVSCPASTLSVWDEALQNRVCGSCPSGTYCEEGAPNERPCPVGHYCPANTSAPLPCPRGSSQAMSRAKSFGDCRPCLPGSFGPHPGGATCISCHPGYHQKKSGAASCERCLSGHEQPLPGRPNCLMCTAGNASMALGSPSCTACSLGSFAASNGSSTCERCVLGRFADMDGSSACRACPGGRTTPYPGAHSVDECLCAEASFMGWDGECYTCPVGMWCPLGSDLSLFQVDSLVSNEARWPVAPQVLPGYMVLPERPLEVYECTSEALCPGGGPGICQVGAEGIACGSCSRNFHLIDRGCVECHSQTSATLLVTILPTTVLIFVVFFMHYLYVDDDPSFWGVPFYGLCCLPSTVIIFLQTLALLGRFQLKFTNTTRSMWDRLDYVLDIVSFFNVECTGFNRFNATFLVMSASPLILLAVFFAAYALSIPLRRIHWVFALDKDILWRCYGCLAFTFVTSVQATSLSLFQCKMHPCGKMTLISAPDFLCYGQSWFNMLAGSVVALLVFCVGGPFLCCWKLWKAPKRSFDEVFIQRWCFLFCQYRASAWWWSMAILLKALMLNLCTVVFSDGALQLYVHISLTLIYLCGLAAFKPWRHLVITGVDTLMHIGMIHIATIFLWLAKHEPWMNDFVGVAMVTIFGVLSLCIAIGVVLFVIDMFAERRQTYDTGGGALLFNIAAESQKLHAACEAVVAGGQPLVLRALLRASDYDRQVMKFARRLLITEGLSRSCTPRRLVLHRTLVRTTPHAISQLSSNSTMSIGSNRSLSSSFSSSVPRALANPGVTPVAPTPRDIVENSTVTQTCSAFDVADQIGIHGEVPKSLTDQVSDGLRFATKDWEEIDDCILPDEKTPRSHGCVFHDLVVFPPGTLRQTSILGPPCRKPQVGISGVNTPLNSPRVHAPLDRQVTFELATPR